MLAASVRLTLTNINNQIERRYKVMPNIVDTDTITARVLLETEPPEGNPYVNVPLDVRGSAVATHALVERSGIYGGFGSGSDHTHFEHQNFHPSLKQSAVIYMFRGHGDPNSVSLAGRSDFWSQVEYTGTENSIDTTATAQTPSSPDYKATVKLRYTSNPSLPLNTPIILQITAPVAGIQAAMYGGKVTQIPTDVGGGVYEVLVEVNGFDSLHWNAANEANTSAFNDNWRLLVTASPIQPSNKNGIDGNYEGRADQILVKFNAAHGLAQGDCVVLNVAGTLTGLTGLLSNTQHSGYVSKVVSSTQAAVVLGIIQLPETHPTTSGSTTVTSWDLYTGAIDPFHHLMLPAQCWTFWRNAAGLTSRVQIGALTTVESNNSAALGFDNFLKSGTDYSNVVGRSNKITAGTNAGIFGNSNSVNASSGTNAGIFGNSNTVNADNCYDLGQSNSVGSPSSMAVGHNNTISGSTSTSYAFGYNNSVSNNGVGLTGAAAFGHGNNTTHSKSYLFGRDLTSANANETAIGWGNTCKIRFDSQASPPKLHLADGMSMACGATSGNRIGAATSEKLAFHGVTPVVQRAGAAQVAVATTAATNVSPYGFTTAAQANAIVTLLNEIRAALVEKGLMKGAA